MVSLVDFGQSLLKVGFDVIDRLDANTQTDHVWWNTSRDLLLWRHLRVSSRCRMDTKRLAISDVGDMTEQLKTVDQFLASLNDITAGHDSKYDDATSFPLEIFIIQFVRFVALKPRVTRPRYFGVTLQVFGNLERVLAVTFHTQTQRFNSLDHHPRIIRRQTPTQVA